MMASSLLPSRVKKKSGEGGGGREQVALAGLAWKKHRAPPAQLCCGEVMDPGVGTRQFLQRRRSGTESWLTCYLCLN